jgi:hypothetical protein
MGRLRLYPQTLELAEILSGTNNPPLLSSASFMKEKSFCEISCWKQYNQSRDIILRFLFLFCNGQAGALPTNTRIGQNTVRDKQFNFFLSSVSFTKKKSFCEISCWKRYNQSGDIILRNIKVMAGL